MIQNLRAIHYLESAPVDLIHDPGDRLESEEDLEEVREPGAGYAGNL